MRQLRGSLVAALLAEQKTTEHDDGPLRFVLRSDDVSAGAGYRSHW